MGTGKPRISTAVRVLVPIVLAAELGTDPVRVELELVREVAVRELVAESLAIVQAAAQARVIVRGAEPVRVIVPGVELVLLIVLAKVALTALAEVRAPEIVQVEAAPELDRVAVPLRIKSVTGPRRHDQVLLLTVEDLAVEVVETTRERAVTEAVIAWEVAE